MKKRNARIFWWLGTADLLKDNRRLCVGKLLLRTFAHVNLSVYLVIARILK
jgi:hypothetical protein